MTNDEIAYNKVKALKALKQQLNGQEPTDAQLANIGCEGLREIYRAIGK